MLLLFLMMPSSLTSSLHTIREEGGGGDDPIPNNVLAVSPFVGGPKTSPSLVQSPLSSPYLAHKDEDILTRVVQDCGLHAYGAIFLEVWVLSSNGRCMTRPSGGHWMDPQFIHSISPPSLAQQVDEHAPDCAPGVSLAGTLYNETSQWGNRGVNRKVHWRQIKSMIDDPFLQDDGRIKSLHDDLGIGFVATVPFYYHGQSGIVLFMSRSTCNVDRLRSTANENFLIAAADLIGASYAIRIPRQELATIRREMLQSAVRKVVALLKKSKGRRVGSIVDNMRIQGFRPTRSFTHSMFRPEPETVEAQEDEDPKESNEVPDQWRHPGKTLAAYGRIGWSTMSTIARQVSSRVVNSIRKWEGAVMKGPPRTSAPDCVIIFIMVTLAMLTVLRMDDGLERAGGSDINYRWHLNGGWFVGTIHIVFALTSAPVGQPRQIIGAQIISALSGLAFQQIPSTPNMLSFGDFAQLAPSERSGLPLFWRESLAVGVGVAVQAWLGVVLPPATFLAFSFAQSDKYQISNLIVMILAGESTLHFVLDSCLAISSSLSYFPPFLLLSFPFPADLMLIALGTVLLNLQKNKQYPTFWLGFSWKYPNTKAELTERFTRKKGRNKTDRDVDEKTPQDRATTLTTATGSSEVEKV